MEELLKKCPYCRWMGIHIKPHIRRVHLKDVQEDLKNILKHKALKQHYKEVIEAYVGEVL